MITQPPDIVSLAQPRSTNQTEGGTALAIVRSSVDKAIKVSGDAGYISIGAGVDILKGHNFIHMGLAIHKVLLSVDRWTVGNQLSRDKLCGQTINIRSRRSIDQSMPLGGGMVRLDDI